MDFVLLVFALTLLVAVLFSEKANRTVFSIPLLFIVAGVAIGSRGLNFINLQPDDEGRQLFLELALFVVLFVDGMHLDIGALKASWKPAGRVLAIGLPLTLILTTLLGYLVTGFTWLQALLVAAVLSPTDPMFASALVQREDVPKRLQRLLNVESGLNDGIALPIVLTLLAYAGVEELELAAWLGELALGILLGVVIAWIVIRLEGLPMFDTAPVYTPLVVLTIGMLVYALAHLLHANLFFAAFAAGVSVASFSPSLRDEFEPLGSMIAELFKLAALLAFGMLLSLSFVWEPVWQNVLFALLILLVARPAAVLLLLGRHEMTFRERLAAAWFGPRGFTSVFYGLLVLGSGVAGANELFSTIAMVIVISIIAHSSTDALVAQWLSREKGKRPEGVSSKSAD
jgi:NhaP-type Na+/H+ or K+/H+ antiporter